MGDRRDGRNNHETLEKLILPEVLESVRRQGRVADRGHDRSVAEIGLDSARVVAVIGELEPAGMGVNVEREAGALTDALSTTLVADESSGGPGRH